MRTHDGNDARDSYEHARDAMGENFHSKNDDIESNERIFQETPSDVAATMRSLIKAQEEQHQLNVAEFDRLAKKDRFWTRYIKGKRKQEQH